jgi:putative oxidoreductase
MSATATAPRSTAANRALWTLQIVLGVFLVVASAGPKFFGEATAVDMFLRIGLGEWFRYFVGALELLGGVGLLVRRFSGLAALGLVGLMIGAAYTQAFVLHGGALVVTPIVIGLLCALIAYARRDDVRALLRR